MNLYIIFFYKNTIEENVNLSQIFIINEDDNIINTPKKQNTTDIQQLEVSISNDNEPIMIIEKKQNEAKRPEHILRREIFILNNIIMTVALLCIPVINFCLFSILSKSSIELYNKRKTNYLE